MSKPQEPASLSQLLPRVLARLATSSGSAKSLTPLWAQAAGSHIARHAEPFSLQDGLLTLSVSSAQWAKTLEQEAPSLCQRLNEQLGEGYIKALAFRLGG